MEKIQIIKMNLTLKKILILQNQLILTNLSQIMKFQGYLVYQLKSATVSVTDLDDLDKSKISF